MSLPVVEPRSIEDFLGQIRRELGPYGEAAGPGCALTHIAARYAELIGDRLNQMPAKLMLAYFDLLGASRMPPEPARVPLTFYLAEGAGSAWVKRGTQVEAIRTAGEKDAVVFETEIDLRLTAALLDTIMWKDPAKDEYADLSAVLSQPFSAAVPVFGTAAGNPGIRTPHELWVSFQTPEKLKTVDALRLQFRVASAGRSEAGLSWEYLQAGRWTALQPVFDTTAGLAKTGDVVFRDWEPKAPQAVLGRPAHWFRCRWLDPIASGPAKLPVLSGVSCAVEVSRPASPPQRIYAGEALDPTREAWVFGAKPGFGSTFYLRHDEAFGVPAAQVTVEVDLLNPAGAGENSPVPPVHAVATQLNWEAWDGSQWTVIGRSRSGGAASDPLLGFEDGAEAFTRSGGVRLRLPEAIGPVEVAGETGYWIRVRLVFGDYGREAGYKQNADGTFVYTPASFAPPVVRSFRISFQTRIEIEQPIVVRNHDFQLENVTGAFPLAPFLPIAEPERDSALYFGFQPAPEGSPAAPIELSIYFLIRGQEAVSAGLGSEATWERSDPVTRAWIPLPVHDSTLGLERSGIVRMLGSMPAAARGLFFRDRIWIRLRPEPGATAASWIEAALPNTAPALHARSTNNEMLGSASGKPSQRFSSARNPVLEGQQLQILEATAPSSGERAVILRDEGPDALEEPEPGQGRGVWVRWHETPDFQSSGPRDRHYTVDRPSGVFQFGDGVRGMPPPAGTTNVRLRRYQTGGGSAGNKPAGSVINLKTSLPHVARVVNHTPAAGGSDLETMAELRERFPRDLRHHDRAVTLEDYEDLAKRASRQVQRVKCVPLYDLGSDPAARRRLPGVVSLIVLPRSLRPRPLAETELLARVREYIDERRPPATRLVVVSPEFLRIDIEAEVVVSGIASRSQVEAQAAQALQEFLHPCAGRQGEGWEFGELPNHSAVYAILEAIPGLEYVTMLRIHKAPEREGAEAAGRFVIYCGEPRITARIGN